MKHGDAITHWLEPMNEGETMNVWAPFGGSNDGAVEEAKKIAAALQAALFNASIFVRVTDQGQGFRACVSPEGRVDRNDNNES